MVSMFLATVQITGEFVTGWHFEIELRVEQGSISLPSLTYNGIGQDQIIANGHVGRACWIVVAIFVVHGTRFARRYLA